jgi:hypothetical protein
MRAYLAVSIFLILLLPLIASYIRSLRGQVLHIGFLAFFHAIGAVLLSLGFSLLDNHRLVGWVGLFLALDFYAGALLFLYFAKRDADGASCLVLEDIIREHPTERIVLSGRRLLWPIVMFPTGSGRRMATFTGRYWVRGIKTASSFAQATLTTQRLLVQLLFPKVPIIDIPLKGIKDVAWFDQRRDTIQVRYATGRYSALTKLLAFSGGPKALQDTVLLVLNTDDSPRWFEVLSHGVVEDRAGHGEG